LRLFFCGQGETVSARPPLEPVAEQKLQFAREVVIPNTFRCEESACFECRTADSSGLKSLGMKKVKVVSGVRVKGMKRASFPLVIADD